ncbi:MAG: MFS transporter [Spirochaetota bacterium]
MSEKSAFRGKELYAIIMLALLNLFLYADQNLMAPNLTAIAHSFGMTDLQRDELLGGQISLLYWIIGGVVTLGIGYLTDIISRKNLFSIAVLFSGAACLLSAFVSDGMGGYEQFKWLRAITGIGIGASLPLTFSLIGDLFDAKHRAEAAGVMALAMGLGTAVGQLLAGFTGTEYGWRFSFIAVSIPRFIFLALFFFTVKEPARGRSEADLKALIESGQTYDKKINLTEYLNLFKIRTNLLMFLQGIPGTVPWGVFFIYLNDFFAQEKGFTVEMATLIVMAFGASAILGGFFGGLIGNWVYNKKPYLVPVLCGVTTIIGCIPVYFLVAFPPQQNPSALIPVLLGLIAGFVVTITGPNVRLMLMNVNAPETRGSIFSLFNLTDDLGKGLGPWVISLLIAATAGNREFAFQMANLFWLACGSILLLAVFTFPKDEANMNRLMKERAAQMKK